MANKLIKRKYNNLLSGRNNYYSLGSQLKNAMFEDGKVGFNNMTKLGEGITKAVGTAVGQLGGQALSGGMSSGVGSAMSGLGSIASAIPGPWGAVASAGLGLVGGVTNRMFGSKLNEENIAKVQGNISNLNNFQSDASNFDALSQNWANAETGMTFDDSFIGKDGWFSNKAKNKAADLRRQIEAGNSWVQNSLNNNADSISTLQAQNLLANYAAFGGDLMTHGSNFDTGITLVGNGGTHETNPNEGVPMGVDQEGVPNLVEEGEVIFNDYVFSNRLKVPKAVRQKYKLRGNKSLTFADAALKMAKESEERPNDSISKNGLRDSMTKLMIAQELLRTNEASNVHAKGGKLGRKYAGTAGEPYPQTLKFGPDDYTDPLMYNLAEGNGPRAIPQTTFMDTHTYTPREGVPAKNSMGIVLDGASNNPTVFHPGSETISNIVKGVRTNASTLQAPVSSSVPTRESVNPNLEATWMRYVPAFASGVASLTDALGLTNKPDYSSVSGILDAASKATNYTPVKATPIGNYLTYNPLDRDYYINKALAQSGAVRRQLLNMTGTNRAQAMAGLLSSDYNTLKSLGDLAKTAEEYNLTQRQKVVDFNRATDMYNAEAGLKAQQANLSAQLHARDNYFKGVLTAEDLRQKERQASMSARSLNLSNFINSLGDIGRENYTRNMILTDPSKYYTIDDKGQITYKAAYDDLPEEVKAYVADDATRKASKKKGKAKGE